MKNQITVKQSIEKVYKHDWQFQKNCTTSLRNAYVFSDWYGKNKLMNNISTQVVRDYKFHLRNNLKYKDATINRKLASLSKLITYVRGCEGFVFLWGLPIIEYEKTWNRRTYTLSSSIEKELIKNTNELGYPEYNDLWIFLIDVGCRLSEALNLRREDVDDDFVLFRNTKNGTERHVPIFNRVKKILARRTGDRVFPFAYSTVQSVWKKIKKNMNMTGEKDFVIHSLRHTCITRLLNRKVGIEVVQIVVGHNDIRMTQRYNHPSKEDIKSALSHRH